MAQYLLDTHTLIWWWLGDPSLSDTARETLESDGRVAWVSPISGFEIALKVGRGHLPALAEPLRRFGPNVVESGFEHLALTHEHAVRAGLFASAHRDPFDRMLAAQTLIGNLTIITRDPAFAAFGCKTLW